MRHIPLLVRTPPADLVQRAEEATAIIEAEADAEARKELIEKRAHVWGAFKDWLLELSEQKCWFSEAQDCFQDWDVEHYRPKKSAKDLEGNTREGYWWLSFEWTNMRVCGRVGNAKKGTFFPLGSAYVANSTNRDISEEVPYLLDPIKKTDCTLLSFNQLGEAVPAPGIDEWSKQRVKVSVKKYKLDYDKLEMKRKDVWDTCDALLNQIQNLMKDQAINPGAGKLARIEEKMEQLAALASRKSVCSSTAIAFMLKSEVGWAMRLALEADCQYAGSV